MERIWALEDLIFSTSPTEVWFAWSVQVTEGRGEMKREGELKARAQVCCVSRSALFHRQGGAMGEFQSGK